MNVQKLIFYKSCALSGTPIPPKQKAEPQAYNITALKTRNSIILCICTMYIVGLLSSFVPRELTLPT